MPIIFVPPCKETVVRKNTSFAGGWLAISTLFALAAPQAFSLDWALGKEFDLFDAGSGQLRITFLGHASLALEFGGAVVYVDPVRQYGDFARYPKADLVLVTHEHGDHLDPAAIASLGKPGTRVVLSEAARRKLGAGESLAWGQSLEAAGLSVEALPAYNLSPGRTMYHPRERGDNGYLVGAGKLRIYIAGDTEPLPEMASLGPIDIAFLPMNLPYTMTPEQTAQAAKLLRPKVLYPYHFGSTNTAELVRLLAGEKDIELRVRKLQ